MTVAPFCNACGARFEGEDRFCANCGAGRYVAVVEPKPARNPVTPWFAVEHPVVTESRAFWSTSAGGWVALTVLALVVGAGIWAIVGGGEDDAGPTHMLTGSVLILDPANFTASGISCTGRGALADIVPGAPVVIRNDIGDTIATDALEAGTVTPESNCRLRYGVEVPSADRYVFVVGNQLPTGATTPAMLDAAASNAGYPEGTWWITHGYDRDPT